MIRVTKYYAYVKEIECIIKKKYYDETSNDRVVKFTNVAMPNRDCFINNTQGNVCKTKTNNYSKYNTYYRYLTNCYNSGNCFLYTYPIDIAYYVTFDGVSV